MWKVLDIDNGKTLRAGFDTEEAAAEWLDARHRSGEGNIEVREMSVDEEEEYLEAVAENADIEEIRGIEDVGYRFDDDEDADDAAPLATDLSNPDFDGFSEVEDTGEFE